MHVIGLTGYARHGKSTVADYLAGHHGYFRLSFGSALKAMASRIDPVIGVEVETPYEGNATFIRLSEARRMYPGEDQLKEKFPEYRRFIQHLATEGIRTVDNDFWVKIIARSINYLVNEGQSKFVIDDCRFLNEAKFIKGFEHHQLWEIRNDRAPMPSGDHVSESLVGKLGENYRIDNSGTITLLENKIDKMIERLGLHSL